VKGVLAIAGAPLFAPQERAPDAYEHGRSIASRGQLTPLPLIDVRRIDADAFRRRLHTQFEPSGTAIGKGELVVEDLWDACFHRLPETPEHRCPIDPGILLEDRVPDQFLGRSTPVTCRSRIHVHKMPVVADDLEPFWKAIERTSDRVVVEGRREDTNEL